MARRINALVETIDELAAKVAPDDRSDWLNARLDEAGRYKIIDAIVNIDMQDPAATLVPSAQNPADDKDGMRDFSPDTVRRRRRDGFKFAHDLLRPAFENRWRMRAKRSPQNSSGQAEACPPSSRSTLITKSLHELGQFDRLHNQPDGASRGGFLLPR